MGLKFNFFTGNFDFVGSGSGGASYIDGEVANYSALPVTVDVPPLDSAYLVRASQGIWPISYKPAGIYYRTANAGALSDWAYAGTVPDVFSDANFLLYDETDTSKNAQFQLSGITTGTTRTLTVPDASGTLQLTGHASAHATNGTDPLSPASIGAQSLFSTSTISWSSGDTSDKTITAGRALNITAGNYSGGNVSLFLPQTGNAAGDIIVISYSGSNNITVKYTHPQAGVLALATMTAAGQRYRFINADGNAYWSIDPVYTHTHTASAISDSTTAGRALLTAADVAAQRTALELGSAALSASSDFATSAQGALADTAVQPADLGDSATLDVGATTGTVAAGDHTHSGVYATASHTHELADLVATGAASGKVLTSDGDGTASWQDATGGSGGGTKTYARFTARDNQPPSTAFATLDTRNSIAALSFGDASVASAVFVGVMPEGAVLTSGLTINLHFICVGTSGNVRWRVEFERSNTDEDNDSFDTAAEANGAANGTSGIVTVKSITTTNIDGITAGDLFRVRVSRVGNDATNDTASGNAQLVAVEIRSAA